MAKTFELISKFSGYHTKGDETNIDPAFLVSGSQNVLVNDAEKVAGRSGFSLYGAADTSLSNIISSFEWNTSGGLEHALRHAIDGVLEYYSAVSDAWETLLTGLSTTNIVNFTTIWSSAESFRELLFVNHSNILYEWSGAETTYASATTNTITKQGTDSWAATKFLTAGTRQIRIKDDGGTWRTFTYTGGESTTTLTGVTPDPTTFTITAGNIAVQAVRSNANTPASGFTNDIISTLENHVYVACLTRSDVYISKNSSFTDFSFSTPRVPGEGALITMDSDAVGFIPQEENMYITAGQGDWYRVTFTLSSGSATDREVVEIKKLKTAPQSAAQSQSLIAKIKNSIVFISNEPTFDELGRLENIDTPQSKPISDPIKPDFNDADFTGGHVKYWRNQVFISAPNDQKVWIYDISKGYWQPPQTFPVARFAIIGGELYGHSSATKETYKLFDGVNDNGNPIEMTAKFAYRSFGNRYALKNFDEMYTEGYISSNTVVTMRTNYDYKGSSSVQEYEIDGNDDTIIFEPTLDNSLGVNPLGTGPLGATSDAPSTLSKFRVVHTMAPQDFFELQIEYTTSSEDAQFQILSQGPNVRLSPNMPTYIKQ